MAYRPFKAAELRFKGYLPRFFVHHAMRDSTASVDDLRFKALRTFGSRALRVQFNPTGNDLSPRADTGVCPYTFSIQELELLEQRAECQACLNNPKS